MTFFTKYGPAHCDKNCRSEHQTLFPLFGEGLGTRLSAVHAYGDFWFWAQFLRKSVKYRDTHPNINPFHPETALI